MAFYISKAAKRFPTGINEPIDITFTSSYKHKELR